MENVIKRDGTVVAFDRQKIVTAITKAMKETQAGIDEALANKIADEISSIFSTYSVEQIQDVVEEKLMSSSRKDVARAYIIYRDAHARRRDATDDQKRRYMELQRLVRGEDEESKKENSNKDTRIIPTMRDYLAGFTCRELATEVVLPKDIAEAHKAGIIHVHDTDYSPAMPMFNCFSGGTKFVTDKGLRQFQDFHDGDTAFILAKDGVMRKATVRKYGKDKLNLVVLKNGRMHHRVYCTSNHRWILKNGSITTNLKVGDKLYPLQDSTPYEIKSKSDAEAFCIGFAVGDGSDTKPQRENGADGLRVRLCGDKVKYAPYFELAGFSVCGFPHSNDKLAYRRDAAKQNFLNGKAWRFMSVRDKALAFAGLYAADGSVKQNLLCTTDERICSFIEETSSLAGYHISSFREIVRDTNFKKNSRLLSYHFVRRNPPNMLWTVESIHTGAKTGDIWCVEEPVTHSFTLEKGIVTGNCDLINLEDMLQNGTVISKTLIEKPKSFRTACTVVTQIITQVASCQYGGNTISLAHISPFIDVSRQKLRKEVREELSNCIPRVDDDMVNEIAEKRLKAEIKDGVQTIQYQLITMSTTNGQAPFTSVFMYLDEVPDGQPRKDLAMLIEEVLRQRIQGVKNEQGVYITTAFPKLLYCLDEDNIHEDSGYWYLTKLAAECSSKRLVPDYISAKIMRKEKDGNVFPCMNKPVPNIGDGIRKSA